MAPKHHCVLWKKDEMVVCMVELDRFFKHASIIDKTSSE